ncbi:NAD-dependent epimerase/dehydratase family protein [Lactovum odontotermitis]
MKALVTGGNGFVATHLISQLLEKDANVSATVRSDRSEKELLGLFPQIQVFRADLTHADGWKEAVSGQDVIFHVASPLGGENPNDPVLIDEAVSGVENVLLAAAHAGVKRIVMTSSQAASTPPAATAGEITDDFWSDEKNPELNAYRLSKLFAERKAWELAEKHGLALTTILPGAVFGPVLTNHLSSNGLIAQMMNGSPSPKISLEITDVRDAAALHILAFENPAAAVGQRFIAKNNDLTFLEVAEILKKAYPENSKIKTQEVPNFVLKLLSHFRHDLRALTPMLGRKYTHSNEMAKKLLGWQPRPSEETICDAAQSLIDKGLVK